MLQWAVRQDLRFNQCSKPLLTLLMLSPNMGVREGRS
jgi:hypothetical protein